MIPTPSGGARVDRAAPPGRAASGLLQRVYRWNRRCRGPMSAAAIAAERCTYSGQAAVRCAVTPVGSGRLAPCRRPLRFPLLIYPPTVAQRPGGGSGFRRIFRFSEKLICMGKVKNGPTAIQTISVFARERVTWSRAAGKPAAGLRRAPGRPAGRSRVTKGLFQGRQGSTTG
jgi:hypothetical protein